MKKNLYKLFEEISPAELAKIRGKRQDTSTRDKNSLLKKVAEIENILEKLDIEISFNEKNNAKKEN